MAVQANLWPTHSEKILGGMKAPRVVKGITFDSSEASPGETLYVWVHHKVLVPGSLALLFDIDLEGGDANNVLAQNVMLALVCKLVVK